MRYMGTTVPFAAGEGAENMTKGIGLDLCEIARMEKLLEDERFLNRFFTPSPSPSGP